jgi:predicted DNA-binding protein (MmcQ/YjbR family)
MKKSLYAHPSPIHEQIMDFISAGYTDREVADAVEGVNHQYVYRFRQYHGLPPGSIFRMKLKNEKQPVIDHCLSLPEAEQASPFLHDAQHIIIRHSKNQRYFAYIFEHGGKLCVNLKCDPAEAVVFRRTYKSVIPAYHATKAMRKSWNTVVIGGDVPEQKLHEMIRRSHELTKPKVREMSTKEYLKKVCGIDVRESFMSYEKRGWIKKEKTSSRTRARYNNRVEQLRQRGLSGASVNLEND